MYLIKFNIIVLFLFISGLGLDAQNIESDKLKEIVYYLASEKLEGRGTGTDGELMAANYIVEKFRSFGLETCPGFDDYFDYFEFSYSPNPHGGPANERISGKAVNVLGYLNNHADHTIIIGAHYDHLGKGPNRSSREEDPSDKIHYGADDNASGVAGVIALADYFSNNNRTESFNIIFTCFSAEELGLLGSKDLAEKLKSYDNNINYMLNMDMIGRLDEEKRNLHISGIGTAAEWGYLFNKINHTFNMLYDSSGIGGSDHTSFYLANIPAIHFFSGVHSDYHKSTDTPDKINYTGQAEILDIIIQLIEKSENENSLTFQETKRTNTGASRFKVTLGIMPDYAWSNSGLKLDGVSDGKPAHKAGLKAGDIILKIGNTEINNIQDYMRVLGEYESGDQADAIIKRNTEEIKVNIVF
jgi:hypothetical protein